MRTTEPTTTCPVLLSCAGVAVLTAGLVSSVAPPGVASRANGRGAEASARVLLSDDFESYKPGAFPASGGWTVAHPPGAPPGRGAVIDDRQSCSGSKSWRLDDAPIVTRTYEIPLPLPSAITFECCVRVTRRAGPPLSSQVDFSMWAGEYRAANCSQPFGDLRFSPAPEAEAPAMWTALCPGCSEYIYFGGHKGSRVVLGRWYRLRATLDLDEDTGAAWIDDRLTFSGVPLRSSPSVHFAAAISIEAARWGPKGVVWVDDVRVYSNDPPQNR